MEGRKIDRRIIKTKKAIRNAFIKLISEKDFNDISIKDIADYADVDRKTVYNYYSGIFAIKEELENDLVKLWNDAIVQLDFKKNIANPQQLFTILNSILNNNLDLCSNLMKLDSKTDVVRKMTLSLTKLIKETLLESDIAFQGEAKLEIAAQFITSGMLAAYQHWFNSDRKIPLDELSRQIGTMVLFGIDQLKESSDNKENN